MADSTTLPIAFIDLIEAAIWPAVFLYFVYRFQVQIESLLTKIASMKIGSAELIFQEQVNKPPNIQENKSVILNTGPDGFLTVDTLKALVENSSPINSGQHVKSMLQIFQTPNQRTWLVATNDFVFVMLDDESTRKRERIIQDFFERKKTLPLQFREDKGIGVVKFGSDETWWYYSLNLFPTMSSLEVAVRNLVA